MKNILIFVIATLALFIAMSGALFLKNKIIKNSLNTVNIYFVKQNQNSKAVLKPVKRIIKPDENRLDTAIAELLKGPDPSELKKRFSSEIPPETKLLEITEKPDRVVINLSQKFESGGGSSSMNTRVLQVSYTASDAVKKPVYLELEGKEVKYIGGEGIEITQPLPSVK
jgi:spore germination protein GerM